MKPGKSLKFLFDGEDEREITINNLVVAGWTGRNVEAMEAHILELEELGIARPSRMPTFYRCSVNQLTTDQDFQVIGNNSSGEIEFIILSLEDGYWIGLGSDHTDRVVEATDVTLSKQMCSKPIANTLWRFDDVKDHWDKLILQSTIKNDGIEELYQKGPVTTMRDPEELISLYTNGGKLNLGTLMFCGTLAVEGGVRPAETFHGSLKDVEMNRTIYFDYRAISLPAEE